MSDLIDTTEMYLRTVFELEEEGVAPLRARIAERLHHSGPTVSQTVARMERDGLLHLSDDRRIHLTDEGQRRAAAVMRKHRLAERLLIDVIGLDWTLVHDEACRWEHVISDEVEQRLTVLLPDAEISPYGNPIPSAGETEPEGRFREGNAPLSTVLTKEPATFTLERMSEMVQADAETLQVLAEAGLRPGAQLQAQRDGDVVVAQVGDGARAELAGWVADGLFVARA